jgi:glycerophosphoryl diester phosphodiesterase
VTAPRTPRVVAHRGYAAAFPENTLLAFRSALTAGADALECDVHLSADGVPVVIHDADLDRTTDGAGLVAHRSWRTLAGLDAGGWFGAAFAGEPLPRLADVLELTGRARPVPWLYVEIKPAEAECPGVTTAAIASIRAAGRTDRCALGSSQLDVLATAAAAAPELTRHHIVSGPRAVWPEPPVPVQAIDADVRYLDRATCDAVRATGRELNAWTVNEPADVRRLARWGLAGLITDDPATVRRILG